MSDPKNRIHEALDRFRDLVGEAEAKLSKLPASRHSHCYIDVTDDLGEGSPHYLVYRYLEGEAGEAICLVDMCDASGGDDIRTYDSAVWVASQHDVPVSWRLRLIPKMTELIDLAESLEGEFLDDAESALAQLEQDLAEDA